MHKDLADLWAQALESPYARRAHGALDRKYGRRCCLGHLCEALRLCGLDIEKTNVGESVLYSFMHDTSSTYLPFNLSWFLEVHPNPRFFDGTAASLNDNGMKPQEIAPIVRKTYGVENV